MVSSDARTGSVIDERVKPALETGRALGQKKPVLIIVDEVDGATGENVRQACSEEVLELISRS